MAYSDWVDRRELPGGWQVVATDPRRDRRGEITLALVLQNSVPRYTARVTATDPGGRAAWSEDARRAAVAADPRHLPPSTAALQQSMTELAVAAQKLLAGWRSGGLPDSYPLTDLGNAERLIARHGEDLHYCPLWKRWLLYDGQRWASDDTGEVMRRAKDTVRAIYGEAADSEDAEARKALAEHARASERRVRLEAMVALAQSEPGVSIIPDRLDKDPWLLNVGNGTIDLRTGQLREHRREDLITKLASVDYDPAAACPIWLAFLDRIMDGRGELVAFLRRAVGYTLTGSVRERVLFILHGSGRNGKSTLQETLLSLFSDYGEKTPAEILLVKREGAISNDIARLKGARFVPASETNDGSRLAEATIKELTGGDTITARFLYSESFSFQPEFKIWLATNHKPLIRGTDAGIWDRIRLIPFDVRISDNEQDPTLRERLRTELPGILAWAVAGCAEWRREGLRAPGAVTDATASYRAEQDIIGAWLGDCCLTAAHMATTATALYTSYTRWCEANGERAMAQRTFGQRLGERGFEPGRGGNGRCWKGVGLLATEDAGK